MNEESNTPFFLSLLHRILPIHNHDTSTKQTKRELLTILRQGADVWGTWREYHSSTVPDLSGVDLRGTNLEGVYLGSMHLEEARFKKARLKGANLSRAHLSKASFNMTDLKEATLIEADLREAFLGGAYLEAANLSRAHLEGASLVRAHLEGTDLSGAFFDATTQLDGATLGSRERGFAYLVDCHWNDVNLAVVDWSYLEMLGEEYQAHQSLSADGSVKERSQKLEECQKAVRANRQLSVALKEQGLSEEASRFAYRAQVLQREVLLLQIPQQQQRILGQLFSVLAIALGSLSVLSFLLTVFLQYQGYRFLPFSSLYSILTCSPWVFIHTFNCTPIQDKIALWLAKLPPALSCLLLLSLGLLLLALFPETYLLRKNHRQETLQQNFFSIIVLLLGILLTVVSLVLLLPIFLLSIPFPLLASPFIPPSYLFLLVQLSKRGCGLYHRMIKTRKDRLFRFLCSILLVFVLLLLVLLLTIILFYWFLAPLLELLDLTTIVLIMLPLTTFYILWKGLLFIHPIKLFKQRLQRQIRSTLAHYGQYALSLFLDAIAGYGYKPERCLGWYFIVIIGFAIAASLVVSAVSNSPPSWQEALVFSITSFHGRGFFPSPDASLKDPLTALAAVEAVIGLIIEISFIATFTQRFFGK